MSESRERRHERGIGRVLPGDEAGVLPGLEVLAHGRGHDHQRREGVGRGGLELLRVRVERLRLLVELAQRGDVDARVGDPLAELHLAVAVDVLLHALGEEVGVGAVERRLGDEEQIPGLLQRLAVGQLEAERDRALGIGGIRSRRRCRRRTGPGAAPRRRSPPSPRRRDSPSRRRPWNRRGAARPRRRGRPSAAGSRSRPTRPARSSARRSRAGPPPGWRGRRCARSDRSSPRSGPRRRPAVAAASPPSPSPPHPAARAAELDDRGAARQRRELQLHAIGLLLGGLGGWSSGA